MEITQQIQTRKKNILQSKNTYQHQEFAELQRNIQQLTQQNHKKYTQIIDFNPNFKYQLYKKTEMKSQSLNFGRELLIRQLDRLMEQQNYLDRQLSLITFQKQQSFQDKQDLVSVSVSPFQVLQNVWKQDSRENDSVIQQIETLNQKIGFIKISIQRLTNLQKCNKSENNSEYLRMVMNQKVSEQICPNCDQKQSSKKQLRDRITELQKQISILNKKNNFLEQEVAKRDEIVRRMNKKNLQLSTEYRSKIMYLQEKLIMNEHQIKNLKKFKNQLEKNVFTNQQQQFQIFIKTQQNLQSFQKQITTNLQQIMDVIVNNEQSTKNTPASPSWKQPIQKEQIHPKQTGINLLLNQLALPLAFDKINSNKSSLTQRPKTDRKRVSLQCDSQKIQELQIGKKYMRTNQLTSRRNNKPYPCTPADSKHTISTLKLSDSPKSIEQQKMNSP